jgi:hypothetical protein
MNSHTVTSRCKAVTEGANRIMSSAYTTMETGIQPIDSFVISTIKSSIEIANKYGERTPP